MAQHTRKPSVLVNIRMDKKHLDLIDAAINSGMYRCRSEYIRSQLTLILEKQYFTKEEYCNPLSEKILPKDALPPAKAKRIPIISQ